MSPEITRVRRFATRGPAIGVELPAPSSPCAGRERGDRALGRSRSGAHARAIRVLETSHPPNFYIPLEHIAHHLLSPAGGTSFCEWTGPASYWSLVDGDRQLPGVGWSYRHPSARAELLTDRVAFYANDLDCTVGGAPVRPQPGGFYGG